MKKRNSRNGPHRPEVLENAPLHYAPENELGVVFLFAHVAKQFGLRVDKIRREYPDCIAYRRTSGGEKKVRIEFEYRSSAFKRHRHSTRGCDMIVCWVHDWRDCPKHLEILELRRMFGFGFQVWITSVRDDFKRVMCENTHAVWSVPNQARRGDLVLYYFTRPESAITFIYELTEDADYRPARWKPGKDSMARIARVCRLTPPITLEELRRDRTLRKSSFARHQQGRHNMTEYWPYLYQMILRRNHKLKKSLEQFDPEAWARTGW